MKKRLVNYTDRELLAAIQEGDKQSFKIIFDKYWNDLFIVALQKLRSPEDAKDIVQDVFLSCWNNIANITIEHSLAGYLYTALRNKIFNHFEKNSNHLRKLMELPFSPVENEPDVFKKYCSKELKDFINRQVSLMPEKMRNIYLLSRESHFSNKEIAALLHLSEQTVKNQLYNALSRLKKSLISEYLLLIPVPACLFL